MEASDPAMEVLGSHGFSQPSPRRIFVPRQPPRPRQRGALPRSVSLTDEEASLTQQQRGAWMEQHIPSLQSRVPSLSHQECSASVEKQTHQVPQRGCFRSPMEEQKTSMRQTAPIPDESRQGHFLNQSGTMPQHRGSLMNRQNPLRQRDGLPSAAKFPKSWQRGITQQSHQRGAMPLDPEQTYRPRQRGAIQPPFQEQAFQAPCFSSTGTHSSLASSVMHQSAAQEPQVLQPFLETKTLFSEMWLQLEAAIQGRERMLMDMKAEMEKSLSQVKTSKADALKEREDVEERKVAALKTMENICTQDLNLHASAMSTTMASSPWILMQFVHETGKLKNVRESLEQISTDLSVQVAELNQSLQQRVLRVLESLKNHYDVSENEDNNFVDKNLQECEVKLATMERELASSKQTSELLEKAALKRIGDLEEIEAGCVLPVSLVNESSSNLCVVQPKLQIYTDRIENFSETRIDAWPFGLNGEQKLSGHAPVLKRPKLEPMG